MSDYSSQPLEAIEDVSLRSKDPYKFKRLTAGRPRYSESMSGILERVLSLYGSGHQFSLTVTCSNKLGRGEDWNDSWEIGVVDPKSFATLIESGQQCVHGLFDKKANSYEYEFKRLKKIADEKEQKSKQLTRQREDFETLSSLFLPSSVRHLI
jgi:hypothetical protein